jgi:hypothetical protein
MRSKTIWNTYGTPNPDGWGERVERLSHPDGGFWKCSIILFTRVLEQWNTPRDPPRTLCSELHQLRRIAWFLP